jgi:hypothetical protein
MATAELVGVQEPRVLWLPERASTDLGREAVELSASAGQPLDPWQAFWLENSMAARADGKWAAFEVGGNVARQNGKGSVLEARELYALFEGPERLIVHSAHQFDTSLEHFRRLLDLIEANPEFDKKVKRVSRSHGEEGIETVDRSRIRFRTRTKGGGRGFSGDLVVLDEAMELSTSAHGALLPTVRARPNPQIWYTGSAVDQNVHEHGIVFARIRERGHAGGDPRLAYFEWSAEGDLVDAMLLIEDERAWAQANPGLGIRIDLEHVQAEARSLDPRTFAVELLGIGDWPDTAGSAATVIDPRLWSGLTDASSSIQGDLAMAIDTAPDRSFTTVAAAGRRPDGVGHVEVMERQRGTAWVLSYVLERVARHDPVAVVLDARGPVGSLAHELEAAGVRVVPVNAQEHAQACGMFFDSVQERDIHHLGTQELGSAVRGAAKRPLGDAWAWSRKTSAVDISPLVASTLAWWGLLTAKEPVSAGFEVF